MLETARSRIVRHVLVVHGVLGLWVGALVALAAEPSLAGGRGLRAAHAVHRAPSGRVHVSHGVEVVEGCGFDSARPGRLAPRPVAHRPLRGVPDPAPHSPLHERPIVIIVDDGPEIVIDEPGVVIIVE